MKAIVADNKYALVDGKRELVTRDSRGDTLVTLRLAQKKLDKEGNVEARPWLEISNDGASGVLLRRDILKDEYDTWVAWVEHELTTAGVPVKKYEETSYEPTATP